MKLLELPDSNRSRSFEEWDEWENKMKKEYPIKYFLKETVPFYFNVYVRRPISDMVYWVKCHFIPRHKYHLIDIRQPKEWNDILDLEYRYGWIDRDRVLLLASMKIMLDFVDKEKNGEQGLINYINQLKEIKDWDVSDHIKKYDELHNIYRWWKYGRYNDYLMLGRNYSYDEENRLFEKDTEMMKRLAGIRGIMWT